MMRLFASLLLAACASPRPPEPKPAVVTTPPPPASAETPSEAPAPSVEAPDPKADLDARVQSLVDATNAGDLDAAESLSTPDCWHAECGSFATQAKHKFKIRRMGELELSGPHAVANAGVVCDGNRSCDFVHFLWLREGRDWVLADVVEDDDKAKAWLGD